MQLRFRWAMVWPTRFSVWGPADEPPAASAPIPAWQGGRAWDVVLQPHDATPVSAGGTPPPPPPPADAEAVDAKAAGSAEGEDATAAEWLDAGWTPEEARLAASREFQAEILRDRHAKLSCFAETPTIASRFWLAQACMQRGPGAGAAGAAVLRAALPCPALPAVACIACIRCRHHRRHCCCCPELARSGHTLWPAQPLFTGCRS